jgi:hypothetical protein
MEWNERFRTMGAEGLPGRVDPERRVQEDMTLERLKRLAPDASETCLPSQHATMLRPEERAMVILETEDDGPMSELLHTLWTKAVGTSDYDKREWQALEIVLYRMRRKIRG